MKYFENKTIIVPFDFSKLSQQAVEQAVQWADETTSIHVIHVVDSMPTMISFDPALPVPPSYDHGVHKHALEKMTETFSAERYGGLKIHCEIGDPGSEIVGLARTVRANMIIMPSHGRRGLSRLLMGSVTERVLRLAHCPVMVLRDDEDHESLNKSESAQSS